MKIAIIGLDTSHTIQFTKLIQGDETPEDQKIKELQISNCMRFPSAFQAEDGQDERQSQLEKWGVNVTNSFDEAIEGAEGIMLEINDPALHLEYFEKAAGTGLPVFLDKPLAGTLEDGRKILQIAKEKNVKVWSSSSLRFTKEISECTNNVPSPIMGSAFGPMGKAPAGSSFIWYGVHTFEMLSTIMGSGAQAIQSREDANGIVSIVDYSDGRRGVAECNNKSWFYGGKAQTEDKIDCFYVQSGASLYYNLILQIRDFFTKGTIPVTMEDTLEILAMMVAGEKSLKSGKSEKVEI